MKKNPVVDEYLKSKNNPMQAEIERVCEIILNVHPDIEETIKWSSPTFMYKGNMASYFISAKKHVSLMFHKEAMMENKSGLLQVEDKEARTAKFTDMNHIEQCK